MTYAQKLKDPRWQKLRLRTLEKRGWKCERCSAGHRTLHVHHKRYRGQPWEAGDADLEVLCEPCHSAEHGKTTPRTKRFSVYCAGKIGISDWRHRLFDLSQREGYESLWASEDGLIQVSYAGPYFAESQHGLAHGESKHGQGGSPLLEEEDGEHVCSEGFEDLCLDARMARRLQVYDKCREWLDKAESMFVYIDGPGAYGTCLEVEWFLSKNRGKNTCAVVFSTQQLLEDYWFLASRVWGKVQQDWSFLVMPDVNKAFSVFAKWVGK